MKTNKIKPILKIFKQVYFLFNMDKNCFHSSLKSKKI